MEIRCLESHVTQVLGVVVVAAEISGPVKFAVRIVRSDCEQFDKIAFTFEMFDQYIYKQSDNWHGVCITEQWIL